MCSSESFLPFYLSHLVICANVNLMKKVVNALNIQQCVKRFDSLDFSCVLQFSHSTIKYISLTYTAARSSGVKMLTFLRDMFTPLLCVASRQRSI